MSKDSFLKGAAILGIAGILIKILGAIYRIPLINLIGDEGIGYYQTSYPIYNLLFSISTAGIPVAIAKLVSEKRVLGDYRGAQRVFRISFIGLLLGGILTSIFIFFGAEFIVNRIGNSNAYYSMIALVPALFFVPIMSSFRGYFQGCQNMTPTALSQVFEQLFRVIIGLFLAYKLFDYGLPLAAGGASFGASAGAIAGTIVMIIIYVRKRGSIKRELEMTSEHKYEETSVIIKRILSIAIPISIGACIVPLFNIIDVSIVMDRLQAIGFTEAQANDQWGQYNGMAQTLINFPQVISIALAMSLVPAISAVHATNNFSRLKKITRSGIRITLLIGLPAALGLYVLSTPIIKLLYYKRPLVEQVGAGSILSVLSFSVIFLTLVQCFTAILQGLGRPIIPVRNLAIGSICKAVLSFVLIGIPGIEVKGAAISTIVSYLIAASLNFIEVKRYTNIDFNLFGLLFKPVVSAVLMTIAVKLTYIYTSEVVSNNLATIMAILVGVVIYGFTLLLTGAITARDFELMPAGNKVSRVLKALGLLRR